MGFLGGPLTELGTRLIFLRLPLSKLCVSDAQMRVSEQQLLLAWIEYVNMFNFQVVVVVTVKVQLLTCLTVVARVSSHTSTGKNVNPIRTCSTILTLGYYLFDSLFQSRPNTRAGKPLNFIYTHSTMLACRWKNNRKD